MAACDLILELDEKGKFYTDGETVEGTLTIRVHKELKCKGLIISTNWQTHGRGNVDTAQIDFVDVFSGTLQPGEEHSYPFKLKTATWPPTYFGTLMNVTHSVKAQAKIPWAFDPRSSVEIPVVCTKSQAEAEQVQAKGSTPLWAWVIGAIFIAIFGFMFIFLIPLLLVIGGIGWFFASYLPRSVTGKVECEVLPLNARPGEKLTGRMNFRPKRSSVINGVTAKLICQEVCVSGSGSNRTTHRHEVFNKTLTLVEKGKLTAGKDYDLEFDLTIPPNAPPSLDLDDNDLNWHVEMRVDIPRWPDFKKDIRLVVLPKRDVEGLVEQVESSNAAPVTDEWLTEVLGQLQATAEDPDRLAMVLEAISDHSFDLRVETENETLRPTEAEDIYGGTWLKATDPNSNQKYLLHYDRDTNLEPNSTFVGKIKIVNYQARNQCALAQVFEGQTQ